MHKRPSIEDSILQPNVSWNSVILIGHAYFAEINDFIVLIRSNLLETFEFRTADVVPTGRLIRTGDWAHGSVHLQ